MAYDSLLFDLDGTLWDTTRPVAAAWNWIAQQSKDLPKVTENQVRSVMGMAPADALAALVPDVESPNIERSAPSFFKAEIDFLKGTYLYPDVAEGLRSLSKLYPLFIVSNCQTEYLKHFLKTSGLKSLFKDWECYGRTGRPKGENISSIMRRHRLKAAAYVGDTAGDQIAAKEAGADFYHAAYGFGSPASDCLAFANFKELERFFLSLAPNSS